jgi:type II secretory pathway pseudopilin PulG
MTQTPDEPIPVETTKKGGVPVFVWILGGCGCLGAGAFVILILAAIALPSFLNQIGKARGSEAKSILGTVNRAQQAHYLEKGSFAKSLDKLDARFSPKYFSYKVVTSNPKLDAFTTATPIVPDQNLKSYVGFVFLIDPATSNVISGVCESNEPSQKPLDPPLPPLSPGAAVECLPGSSLVE